MNGQSVRVLVGPAQQVKAEIARLDQAGVVEAFSPPRQHVQGVFVKVWLRELPQVDAGRPLALPATRSLPSPRPGWRLRDLSRGQRKAIRAVAIGGGSVAVLGGVVWLIARAVSGAASWASSNPFMAVLVVLALAVVGPLPFTWRRDRARSSGARCPGLVHHCNGCKDHR